MSSRPLLPADWSRRDFLAHALQGAAAVAAVPSLAANAAAAPVSRFASIGGLRAPDINGLRLPAGFSSRVVAVSGQFVEGTLHPWHAAPDGGAVYPMADGGWVYASNSEVPLGLGGAGALQFDKTGRIVNAYSILAGTRSNCAGGKTPWNTWLSCEEVADGRVYECDPFRSNLGTVLPALGTFAHEAVAVDGPRKTLYLTEDDGDGRFYRFLPSPADWPPGASRPQLANGQLQVLRFTELSPGAVPDSFDVTRTRKVIWETVRNLPLVPQLLERSRLGAAAPGSRFRGGEGLWYARGLVYFSTKGDNRIWAYNPTTSTLRAIYDFAKVPASKRILSGVDNLAVTEFGDVLVAEDGGDMQIVVLLPDGRTVPLLQAADQQAGTDLKSEITGPAFSPDGSRLYFSAQRSGRNGAFGSGITFEIRLPFQACPARNACQVA